MASITLSRGEVAVVDDGDLATVSAHRWWAKPRDATNGGYYAYCNIGGRTVYMHRLLMDAPRGLTVDHINGDGLDNRRSNLRLATIGQNNANKAIVRSASGYRGVSRRRTLFRAQIGRWPNIQRGPYRVSAEEAARDYDQFALDRFGEFASLNFPEHRIRKGEA